MTQYNHAFDVAFEVVSEHENWRDIPIKDVLAGLEKRLNTLKENEAEAHDACSGYDVFEVEEGFDSLSAADQRAADESAFQSEQIENIQKED